GEGKSASYSVAQNLPHPNPLQEPSPSHSLSQREREDGKWRLRNCSWGEGTRMRQSAFLSAALQIRSRSLGNSIPATFAACGSRLFAVMPGSELASRHQKCPSGSIRKSIRL